MSERGVSRRTFVVSAGAAGAALVVGFRLWPSLRSKAGGAASKPSIHPIDAWLRLDADGTPTLILAKSEMGQGVMTSMPQILAEELDVDWSRVRVEQAPTNPKIYSHGTGGSTSVRTQWMPLRQAGAAARQMLVAAAAARWHVPASECRTEKGVVSHPSGKTATYAELVADAAKRPVPDLETVPLKDPKDFKIVGRSVPRLDVPAKVDGSAKFGLDARVPGMLFAVVSRCPTFGGKPARFDTTKAKAVAGVRDVFEIPAVEAAKSAGGVAVVANSTYAAIRGRDALDVTWDPGPTAKESSDSLRESFKKTLAGSLKAYRNDGDALGAIAKAAKTLEAEYELPFQAHATMEPMNCTAHVLKDRAEVWAPAQGPEWIQQAVAEVTKFPAEKVVVHTTLMGGGFGRRYQADFGVEAAQVSQKIGAPVMLVWTREDDTAHCFYRPASYHRLSAALDGAKKPIAWLHRMTSTSIQRVWEPNKDPGDSEVAGAADLPYAFPNVRFEYADTASGVPRAWWRSVEHSINGFVTEAFFDEVAAAAGVDPLKLRLDLLSTPRKIPVLPDNEQILETTRLKAVLERAADAAGWGKPLPKGRGRGIACHFSFFSYVAQVAEVSVSSSGKPRVHRVVCAVDCGRVVNPDGVAQQMESAIVYGLSAALKGAITIAEGRVQQSNFTDYDVLRIDEMPAVEVHIVSSDAPPTGTGEPGLPPVAAAVANALFAVTGRRIRRLPIRAEDLKA